MLSCCLCSRKFSIAVSNQLEVQKGLTTHCNGPGRHPLAELSVSQFVPNDTLMPEDGSRIQVCLVGMQARAGGYLPIEQLVVAVEKFINVAFPPTLTYTSCWTGFDRAQFFREELLRQTSGGHCHHGAHRVFRARRCCNHWVDRQDLHANWQPRVQCGPAVVIRPGPYPDQQNASSGHKQVYNAFVQDVSAAGQIHIGQ